MLGKPKFKRGNLVQFMCDGFPLIGKVEIIDVYGTFFDDSDVSYDILVEKSPHHANQPCLYKHIPERQVQEVKQDENH